MCTVKDIYDYIDKIAPFSSCAQWDNVGLLAGDESASVKKAAVVLDITQQNIIAANKLNCSLIISHHPVIFHPIKSLRRKDAAYMLAEYGINAICAHTNLDAAVGGVNDVLAEKIGLNNATPIYIEEENTLSFGRVGALENAMRASDFAELVKHRLNAPRVNFTCPDKMINSVVVSSGSGADFYLPFCINNSIDAFVTSEVKHHQYLEAVQADLSVIDAGHFCTERIVCEPLAEMLKAAFACVEFFVLDEEPPFKSI